MIDIHAHILPGLDDGSQDVNEALEMCKIALIDGIRAIVVAPHHLNGIYRNDKQNIVNHLKIFREKVQERGLNICLYPGSDLHLDANLITELEEDKAMTINNNGKFILLELPNFFKIHHIKEQIFNLKLRGITPIITHPERNNLLMEDINVIYDFIHIGALTQLTAASITGRFGRTAQRGALQLIELNMAHLIATDAHNTSSRAPILSEALNVVTKELGEREARKMVFDIPELIIKGGLPAIKEPIKKKRKSLFSFFRY